MEASEDPPPPADLARLRIHREAGVAPRVRGFPGVRVVLGLGLLAVLLLLREPLSALFSGAGGAAVRTAQATKVVPGQAGQGDVSANGYIVADTQASLASVISGRLVELHAAEGETVAAGSVVARIQFDDLEVQEAQALARRQGAEARLAEAASLTASATARVAEATSELGAADLSSARLAAEHTADGRRTAEAEETSERLAREVERNRSLFEERRIDPGTWDRIQTEARAAGLALEAARAREQATAAEILAWNGQIERRRRSVEVAAANVVASQRAEAVALANVEEARALERYAAIQLEKTRIRAPFEGLVIRRDAAVGEVIAPTGAGNSRGSVLTIVDPASFEVQVELSERRIRRVAEGDGAMVFLDAAPDRGLPARVRKIWPRADRSKGSIEVRVRLEESPSDLRPDMAARVVFKAEGAAVEAGEAFVTVPRAAVARRGGRDVVYVVVAGRVRLREVRLGAPYGTAMTVEAGLEGGEVVVLEPASDLEDGARVSEGS